MTTKTSTTASPEKKLPRSRRFWFIVIAVVVVLIGVGVTGYIYWRDLNLYVTSDDALVHSNMTAITATGAGVLKTWLIEPGMKVQADQTVGYIRPPSGGAGADSFKITAPISGTIIRIDGKEGQIVSPLQPLAYVANLDNLTVWAYIDETQIHRIKAGQQVEVTADATGGVTYNGTVKRVMPATAAEFSLLPASDRTTANFTKVIQRIIVDIDLGNTAATGLYPGMSTNVTIHAPSSGQ